MTLSDLGCCLAPLEAGNDRKKAKKSVRWAGVPIAGAIDVGTSRASLPVQSYRYTGNKESKENVGPGLKEMVDMNRKGKLSRGVNRGTARAGKLETIDVEPSEESSLPAEECTITAKEFIRKRVLGGMSGGAMRVRTPSKVQKKQHGSWLEQHHVVSSLETLTGSRKDASLDSGAALALMRSSAATMDAFDEPQRGGSLPVAALLNSPLIHSPG